MHIAAKVGIAVGAASATSFTLGAIGTRVGDQRDGAPPDSVASGIARYAPTGLALGLLAAIAFPPHGRVPVGSVAWLAALAGGGTLLGATYGAGAALAR